jgi:hypothetical protein
VATHEGLKKVADAEAVNHDGQERQQREQPRGLRQARHCQARSVNGEVLRQTGRRRGWGIFVQARASFFSGFVDRECVASS